MFRFTLCRSDLGVCVEHIDYGNKNHWMNCRQQRYRRKLNGFVMNFSMLTKWKIKISTINKNRIKSMTVMFNLTRTPFRIYEVYGNEIDMKYVCGGFCHVSWKDTKCIYHRSYHWGFGSVLVFFWFFVAVCKTMIDRLIFDFCYFRFFILLLLFLTERC